MPTDDQTPDAQTALESTQPLTAEQLHASLQALAQPEPDPETGLRHTAAEAATLTPAHRKLAILDALTRGIAYRTIAKTYHCGTQTLTTLGRQLATLESGAIAQLMQLDTLAALDAWRLARSVAASEGKHGPAKDWLTFSKALDPPVETAQSGAKVTIIIGQPGRPAGGMTPDILIAQSVSDTER